MLGLASVDQRDLLDAQLFSSQPLEVAPAAPASTERPIEDDFGTARSAASPAGNLEDLEARALGRRSLRRDIEAKSHGIGQHGAETSYLEHHTGDARSVGPRC